MKHIKFIMSKGDSITLPEDKAVNLLNSKEQIILIKDENGEWTGETINKAHIVSTVRDKDAELGYSLKNTPQISEPRIKRDPQKMSEILKRGREKLFTDTFVKNER